MSFVFVWIAWELNERRHDRVARNWIESNGGTVGLASPSETNWWECQTDAWFGGLVRTAVVYANLENDLSPLTELKYLETLEIIVLDLDGVFTGERVDLSILSELKNLKSLKMFGSWSANDLSRLAELTKLKQLEIRGTDHLDISSLAALKNLEELTFHATVVPGRSEDMEWSAFPSVWVYGTIVEEQLIDLKNALPDCDIQVR